MKYPEIVMGDVRQRLGLERDDTSRDDKIEQMSKADVFRHVLNWNGFFGYEGTFKYWVQDIYGVDLHEIDEREREGL